MKDKLEQIGETIAAVLVFVWNLPIILVASICIFLHWLFFDLPKRKLRRENFADEVVHWRLHKQKIAYLAYDRNHPFSDWLEEEFIPKYSKKLIAPKYTTSDVVISDDLCGELYERAEHGGDNAYNDVAEENDDIGALFIFNLDGSVTKWTPPMIDESKVNTRKAKALYSKVMEAAIK